MTDTWRGGVARPLRVVLLFTLTFFACVEMARAQSESDGGTTEDSAAIRRSVSSEMEMQPTDIDSTTSTEIVSADVAPLPEPNRRITIRRLSERRRPTAGNGFGERISSTLGGFYDVNEFEPYFKFGLGAGRFIDADADSVLQLENPLGETYIAVNFGVNVSHHWSAELAIDFVESNLESPIRGKIAEMAAWNFLGQLRFRYPINRYFEPYVYAGAGLSFTEVNDFEVTARDLVLMDRQDLSFIGSAGAGLDFYFTDNMALNLESKYIFGARPNPIFVGSRRKLNFDNLLLTAGVRALLNARDRETGARLPEPRDSDRWRAYLVVRAGKPFYVHSSIVPGFSIEPAANESLVGFAVGVNIGRYLGFEIAGDGGETALAATGIGNVAEYAYWTVMGLLRVRYPMRDDQFVPYVVAGAGKGWGENNDRNVPLDVFDVAGKRESSIVGALGAGVDYFIAHNIALNVEARYTFLFENDLRVNVMPSTIDLSYVGLNAGFRLFLN